MGILTRFAKCIWECYNLVDLVPLQPDRQIRGWANGASGDPPGAIVAGGACTGLEESTLPSLDGKRHDGEYVRKATLGALLLFAILSLVLTYPLALHLGSAVEDRHDALLNVWITAWDGHKLLSDPLQLFEANIFHPYPRTLAYSELLLGNGFLALPITAASGNPVLGYNVALLLSFFLSALGAYLLVLQLTRSPAAGMVAGVIFAYSSFRMTNLAQAQLLTTQWLPFALLALHQLMRRPRARHIAIFVLFFCLQALSSFYYAILLALAVAAFGLWTFLVTPASRLSPHAAGAAAGSLLLRADHPALCATLFPGTARAGL